ncbi:hypothetical protein IX307_000593 [Bacteroides pyogenes]|uniref:CapA family protein n=1 Tax=Bacteroides pyogenes TaxID=310300 RepID=UPI001BA46680|nr:CapA family protein [Bacteroides pyogenes]MBR8719425.1 hypothetical protein [Bacteroides pyogenes]MBR8786290.1 hypothetical protein [Bacteroides pyogenes]MBR8791773.1 hypothetical protein [Bacteroides pyogenes]MCF2708809.1 CapA family protein [Bacteroides pyogenes]
MIYFTGDVNLTDWIFNVGFGIGTNIAKGLDPFKYLERKEGDLWIGNFEGVASPVSANKGIYSKAFRVEPEALENLHHMDIYGFANNHAMEHGGEAYSETVKSLEGYGSKVFGMRDRKSVLFEHQVQKCSITGMCLRIEATKEAPLYWYNPEYKEIEAELASLPADAFKILYVHWGNEYINRPSVAQKKFAHWLLDIGFDLIIGMHPHVLQGYEDYHSKRVYYSLGNCVFDMPSEQCKIGALVGLDFVDGKPIYSEQYLHIDGECCPHVVTESNIPEEWRFGYLNERLKIDDNTEEYHSEIQKGYLVYRKANRMQLLGSAFSHPGSFCGVLMDFIKRRIIKTKQ